jgi:hypothetical protein
MPKPIIPLTDESGAPYTQPTDKPPRTNHSQYSYEAGELRKCHLCGSQQSHMTYDVEEIWFANLQDRARHILEWHRDNRMECERAKEILKINELWDTQAEKREAEFKIPIPFKGQKQGTAHTPPPYDKSYSPASAKAPLITKKRIGYLVLICIICYVLYVLYLMSQGYSF